MNIPTVSDIVCAPEARFVRCQNGQLWYSVTYTDDKGQVHKDWQFPIPLEEVQGGTFLAVDKPMIFMRWIRVQIIALNDEADSQL